MFRALAGLSLITVLVGCQTSSHQTQAHYEQDRIAKQLLLAATKNKSCFDAAKENSAVKTVFAEIIYENDESQNKHTLIASASVPTQEQIDALVIALPILAKCRASMVEGTNGTPYQIEVIKLYNAIDATFIKLLKAQVSIGVANEERSKAIAEYKIGWANAAADLNNRITQMYNAEIEGRRQTAAAMMPYILQQQQNYQNQQQLMYQQQMQSIINNRPTITQPSRTNCTRYGNQIDCVTR